MRVLFLDLDTLRPDHLGCYGYHRQTSPNIDRIASEGVRFDNYYCSDAPCLPSRAALMTGRPGIHTGVVNHGGINADLRLQGAERHFTGQPELENLPTLFRDRGMRVGSISPFAPRHGAWWFLAGVTEYHNPGKRGMESAEDVTPLALDWIERHGGEDDWFLHVNYWDPHTYYRAPDEFGDRFADDPLPAWLTEEVLEEHKKMVGPHAALDVSGFVQPEDVGPYPRHVPSIDTYEKLRKHINGYDNGIRYMDEHIGRLLDALEAKGALDDLMIVVTADHGENQGELGIYAEHGTADQITHRIPLIVRWPGRAKAGHVDAGLHYNYDLAPTLADLLGEEPSPSWEGRSFAPALTEGADCGRDFLVLSQCAHVLQRSVRFGPWLYIRTWHDGFRPNTPQEMLFHIEDDPHEQHDLARERPEICAEGARLYLAWHDAMMSSSPSAADPLYEVLREGGPLHARGWLPRYCAKLEGTDRAWAVPLLKEAHPREFDASP